jgi:hypothetical protein
MGHEAEREPLTDDPADERASIREQKPRST